VTTDSLPPMRLAGTRVEPRWLALAASPLLASAASLLWSSRGARWFGVATAAIGIVALLVFKQYATRLAGEPTYEHARWVNRALVVGLVAALTLLVVHLYPLAEDIATGICACM